MGPNTHVLSEIQRLVQKIKASQTNDGTWQYCFESGPMTDAYMIMILRALQSGEEKLIKELTGRLINTQAANGAWKLYEDEEGNLSATVEAYVSLLYSGY